MGDLGLRSSDNHFTLSAFKSKTKQKAPNFQYTIAQNKFSHLQNEELRHKKEFLGQRKDDTQKGKQNCIALCPASGTHFRII